MPTGHETTMQQFINAMQQAPDLTPRELLLLDRLVMAMDEIDALTDEVKARRLEDEAVPS